MAQHIASLYERALSSSGTAEDHAARAGRHRTRRTAGLEPAAGSPRNLLRSRAGKVHRNCPPRSRLAGQVATASQAMLDEATDLLMDSTTAANPAVLVKDAPPERIFAVPETPNNQSTPDLLGHAGGMLLLPSRDSHHTANSLPAGPVFHEVFLHDISPVTPLLAPTVPDVTSSLFATSSSPPADSSFSELYSVPDLSRPQSLSDYINGVPVPPEGPMAPALFTQAHHLAGYIATSPAETPPQDTAGSGYCPIMSIDAAYCPGWDPTRVLLPHEGLPMPCHVSPATLAETQDSTGFQRASGMVTATLETPTESGNAGFAARDVISGTSVGGPSTVGLERQSPDLPQPRKRRPFTEEKRQETGRTRDIGACHRCRMQRCRCTRNLGTPDGPCDACLKFSKTSKKTIHHVPCSRYKLTEISLFRKGGLAITQRWQGAAVKNIDSKDWDSEDPSVRYVEMQQDVCRTPLRFAVRRFVPSATDDITRRWVSRGEVKMVHLAPYALADVHEAKEIFREYLDTHALDGFLWVVGTSMHDEIAKDVYSMAFKHFDSLRRYKGSDSSLKSEEMFMANLFRLWFAMRHVTGSSWLCGHEYLGMTAVDDETYPLGDKISTPRIVVAQFNSIYITHHLLPLSSVVLRQMEAMFRKKAMKHWMTLFLSTFVLLYEISYVSEDRYRYARQNNQKEEYSLPSFVQELQEGANVILLHWHYLNSGFDPMATNCEATPKMPRPSLKKEQKDFALQIWATMKARAEEVKANLDAHKYRWSLYFVAQMFEKKWDARRTYAGEEVQV